MANHRNWAGNYEYRASELLTPGSVQEVQQAVASRSRLKVLGTRHSFNGIADSGECLLSLQNMNKVIGLDTAAGQVTVEAGIRYGELSRYLHDHGYALHNLASLPHISVVGAIATATHGSGDSCGNLATAVSAMEIVKADGSVVRLSRDQHEDIWEGAVVNLGGLGVVTKLTLDIVPAFQISQSVYDDLAFERLQDHFDDITSSAYSVSLFTDWKQPAFNQVWVKQKLEDGSSGSVAAEFFGCRQADANRHPVKGYPADSCSPQLGVPGPSYERLPHFRMEFTPSAGEELQSEYFVPRERAYEALCALDRLRERIAPLLYVSEVRTVAKDSLWMSPCCGRDSVGIHFTWKLNTDSVLQLLPFIEEALAPFEARPHWAKLFTMPAARLEALYDKLPDFRELLLQFDPEGKFRNDYLNRYVMKAQP
ncbi:FAD-binding protein [Paenibacillus doosanensis]|uniref:Xylitol oxidase n=1 Tax=Paenibacillus konkukensis TaxID=2020716 RepID=A0ABY4RH55_9BACL|nr:MULTISPECIES: FAD-binding protein [Paenibacillus]MCS7461349.1 FAD-binding protein [Paenibacillus doosanensis]UQZ81115.1 putative xylitol oxidase [Paenibacillus konkukensis]